MTNDINTLKLIACATAHLQVHGAEAARVPIPGTDKLIVIGSKAWIASNVASADNPSTAGAAIPEILFDGKAVYDELLGRSSRTSAENVSDVLDAVVRLIRRAAPVAQSTAGASKGSDTIECRAFHELAMDYRGAQSPVAAHKAYVALLEYIDARLAAPALNPSEVRDQALEEAAELAERCYLNRPTFFELGVVAAREIRALKSPAIKAADQQGALGEKGGEA